jgi:hypothetical protein
MAEDRRLLIYLLVALAVNIDAGLFLFFFRQPKDAYQPLLEVIQYLLQGGQKTARLLRIGFLSMEESLHSRLLGLWGNMVLAGGGFSDGYHLSTRTVKEQPDGSFHGPCDQSIDQHGKHGG